MPITVEETPLGQHSDAQGAWIMYKARGSGPLSDVRDAVIATAPATFMGFPRQVPELDEIAVDTDGDGVLWEVKVQYGGRTRLVIPPTSTTVWSGDTTGGSQHVTNSLSFSAYAQSGGTIPDEFAGAIGATKDGVAGVDIVVPAYAFQAVKYIAAASFTAAFRRILRGLTGKVNAASWEVNGDTFAAGEALFLGAIWAERTTVSPADWEVTFKFSAKPNAHVDSVGPVLVDDDVPGWNLLDVLYEDIAGTSGGTEVTMVKQPLYVFSHKVYPDGDFSGLGLS
jgi:hypothetical protein